MSIFICLWTVLSKNGMRKTAGIAVKVKSFLTLLISPSVVKTGMLDLGALSTNIVETTSDVG